MFNGMKITKLFGTFDYDISFKSGGVTIITGPNGYGKSTILKIIDALYRGDISFFAELDFEKIEFYEKTYTFTGNLYLIEIGENLLTISNSLEYISFTKLDNKGKTMKFEFKKDHIRLKKYSSGGNISDKIYEILKSGTLEFPKYLYDEVIDSKSYSLDDICFSKLNNDGIKKNINQIKKVKQSMKEISEEVRFIKEQRLIMEQDIKNIKFKEFSSKNEKFINIIDRLPDDFKKLINEISNDYSSVANNLDSTYPSRLFKTEEGITEKEYNEKIKAMNDKFSKLAKFDISDIKSPTSLDFQMEHSKALKIYFEDFEKKYKVFEEFVIKLEMFTKIVNSRLKFKKIKISREKGIEVIKNDEIFKDDEKNISLNQLSSGEKQEIVLFYELIFQIDDGVHLLIDEPEISLHIAWQLKFMDDLLEIAKYKNLKVTVATHSPQIINNHWDIQIDLGELYGE